jgi:acetyltransferase-like isoleucine patch superfamily enzyme
MFRKLERLLVSNRLTNALLFNRLTGSLGEFVEAARRRRRYDRYRARYDVAPDFEFRGPDVTLYGRGDIRLGSGSYVGEGTRIQARSGRTVRVGTNTAVSHYVFIYTQNRVADQDMSVAPNRNGHLGVEEGDVVVGDDCWVGAFTFVTEGCEIGDNAAVGAHSVVTDDLPPYCIAAGAPARVRRFKSFLGDDTLAVLADEYRDVLADDLRTALCVSGHL